MIFYFFYRVNYFKFGISHQRTTLNLALIAYLFNMNNNTKTAKFKAFLNAENGDVTGFDI